MTTAVSTVPRANKRALIVDDEPDIRELLEITLGRMSIDTAAAADLAGARALLERDEFDLCLTDMHLPDGDGLELVEYIGELRPHLPVAVITAFGSMDTAISALKAGAFDFVQKPVNLEQLRSLVDTALKVTPIARARTGGSTRLLGNSARMVALRAQIGKLARSQAPIYVSGESGSGKEVAARLIHEQGPRADGPFVPVNCGAIPSELMESEFFGHVKGSFTGAVADKKGLFEAAESGTLFLDEVADLPLSMQVKLLRSIQEKTVRPVGSAEERATDVRILCATHKDLAEEVAAGRFRQDLYYRLNVIELPMPSLRDRTEDIAELASQILDRLAKEYGNARPELSREALSNLMAYPFPGNVRELENILERAFTLCEGRQITVADLKLEPSAGAGPTSREQTGETPAVEATVLPTPTVRPELGPGQPLEDYLAAVEKQLLVNALEATRWNKTAAAKRLGITFRALRYRLQKLGLE